MIVLKWRKNGKMKIFKLYLTTIVFLNTAYFYTPATPRVIDKIKISVCVNYITCIMNFNVFIWYDQKSIIVNISHSVWIIQKCTKICLQINYYRCLNNITTYRMTISTYITLIYSYEAQHCNYFFIVILANK